MKLCPRLPLAWVLFGLLVPAAAAGEAGVPGTPTGIIVEPAFVPIGMTYHGATVRVSAEVPAGYAAAIRVMGKAETLEMKRKGKVGRLLWMSVGEATFEAVPVVYFLLTSRSLADSAPASVLREWRLGYEPLARAARWPPGLYPELIKLKEEEGCFLVGEGQLVRSSSAGAGSADRLSGSFRLPARAPAGEYTIDLFGFHGGRVYRLGSTALRLDYTGIARVLRSVATEHGFIYGGVAVVVAVLAGLTTGFVFHPRRGRGK
jgi:hypothetical protein